MSEQKICECGVEIVPADGGLKGVYWQRKETTEVFINGHWHKPRQLDQPTDKEKVLKVWPDAATAPAFAKQLDRTKKWMWCVMSSLKCMASRGKNRVQNVGSWQFSEDEAWKSAADSLPPAKLPASGEPQKCHLSTIPGHDCEVDPCEIDDAVASAEGKLPEHVDRVRISITEKGGLDLIGNTSKPFEFGVTYVRESDYDKLTGQLLAAREEIAQLKRDEDERIDALNQLRLSHSNLLKLIHKKPFQLSQEEYAILVEAEALEGK